MGRKDAQRGWKWEWAGGKGVALAECRVLAGGGAVCADTEGKRAWDTWRADLDRMWRRATASR